MKRIRAAIGVLAACSVTLSAGQEPTRVETPRETMRPRDCRHARHRRRRAATTRSHAGIADPRAGRQRDRRRRRDRVRRVRRRDLALRLRRRSADDDLRREDARGHRDQRPGAGARRRRRRRCSRRRARSLGNGPLGATIPAVMDAMAIALEASRHDAARAGDGSRPSSWPTASRCTRSCATSSSATGSDRAVRVVGEAPTIRTGTIPEVGEIFRQPNLARTLRTIVARRAGELRQETHDRAPGDPRRPRRVLQGRHRAPHRRRGSRGRRRVHLRRSRGLSRADREAGDDHVPRIRRVQGRAVESGPGAAARR